MTQRALFFVAFVVAVVAPTAMESRGAEAEAPFAYVATSNGISVVDLGTLNIVRSFFTGQGGISHGRIAVHPTRPVAYLCDVATVTIVDLASETIAGTIELPHAGSSSTDELLITSDGSRAYTTRGTQLYVIDANEHRLLGSVDLDSRVRDLAPHSDGKSVYVLLKRGEVALVDGTTALVTATTPVPYGAEEIAIAGGGTLLLATLPVIDSVAVVDLTSAEILGTVETGRAPHGIAVSASGARAYVAADAPNSQGSAGPSIAVIDPVGRVLADEIPLPFVADEVVARPDGTELYLVPSALPFESNCSIPVLDVEKRRISGGIDVPRAINLHLGPRHPAPSPLPTPSPDPSNARNICAYLSLAYANQIAVFDVNRRQVAGAIPIERPGPMLLSNDGTRAHVLADFGILTILDMRTGEVLDTTVFPSGSPARIARPPDSPTGAITFTGSCWRLSAVDLTTGEQTILLRRDARSSLGLDENGLLYLEFDPHGDLAYAVNPVFNSLSVIDWPSGVEARRISFEDTGYKPTQVVFHPTSPIAYVEALQQYPGDPKVTLGSATGAVFPIDTVEHTIGAPIAVGKDPFGLAIRPDGSTLYVANAGSNSVTAIDTASGSVRTDISVPGSPITVAVTPDGSLVLVSATLPHGRASLSLIDTTTDAVLSTVATDDFAQDIAVAEVAGPCALTPRCAGDCDGDGRVTVTELVLGVGIALANAPPESCGALDCNRSGVVSVDCVVQAVSAALGGCP